MSFALRPYQITGVQAIFDKIRAGCRRIVFVLPTGGGKTVVAAHFVKQVRDQGARAIFVAHRRELIKQSFCKLVRYGIRTDQIGIMMGDTEKVGSGSLFPLDLGAIGDRRLYDDYGRWRLSAPVQVASIQTLSLVKRKPAAQFLFIDEAHRSISPTYARLCTELQAANPDLVIVGLTATPYRADGRGLCERFDEMVVCSSPGELVEWGAIVEPRIWTVPPSSLPNVQGLKLTRDGDYDDDELEERVDRAELVGDIVEHWLRRAKGRRTVIFATGVAHSMHIVERFRAAGVAAEHLDSNTPTEERDAILARLESGETLVVSNCDVLTEGWDMPAVKCCVLARPTKSLGKYLQMAGRILRPYATPEVRAVIEREFADVTEREREIARRGVEALILDHAGIVDPEMGGFDSPICDRKFTLEARKKKQQKNQPPSTTPRRLRQCAGCCAMVPANGRACEECGAPCPEPKPATTKGEVREEAPGELREFKSKPRPTREEWIL